MQPGPLIVPPLNKQPGQSITPTPEEYTGPLIVPPPPKAQAKTHVEPFIAASPRYFRCMYCPRYFNSWEALESHCRHTKKHDMEFSPYLIVNGREYRCTLCDRSFRSYDALMLHCQTTSRHAWCARCSRVFVSTAALDTHIEQSARHNMCYACEEPQPDFPELDQLLTHLASEHFYCPECDAFFWTDFDFMLHNRYRHFICGVCGGYFSKETDLRAHYQTHLPRNMKCIGCTRAFRTFSAVLVHIESGACKSDITVAQVDRLAFGFNRYIEYTRVEENGERAYRCPACTAEFHKLSRLYQHVERVPTCSRYATSAWCLDLLRLHIESSVQGEFPPRTR